MKIKLYPLYDYAVAIQPAQIERAWLAQTPDLGQLSLSLANNNGWELLCPYSFEAIWHGGASPEEIEITTFDVPAEVPPFIVSHLGHGVLTFHSGYQIKTEPAGNNLWLQGPVNYPKDGFYPLTALLESFRSPCTLSVYWKFTRSQTRVRFEAGEPFATLFPYPANYIEAFRGEIVTFEDPETLAAEMEHVMTSNLASPEDWAWEEQPV